VDLSPFHVITGSFICRKKGMMTYMVKFQIFCCLFQNAVIMTIGLAAMGICIGYIAYMRTKYENMGYYAAVNKDGEESFVPKKSKWH